MSYAIIYQDTGEPSNKMSTEAKKKLREKRPLQSNGLRPKTPGRKSNVAFVSSSSEITVGSRSVSDPPRPYRLNRESADEREKRLAKRKALTLKVFQQAYEDYNVQKLS